MSYPAFHISSPYYATVTSSTSIYSGNGSLTYPSGSIYNLFGASNSGVDGSGGLIFSDATSSPDVYFYTALPVSLSAVEWYIQGDGGAGARRGCASFTFYHYTDNTYTSLVNSWTASSGFTNNAMNSLAVNITNGQYFRFVNVNAESGWGARMKRPDSEAGGIWAGVATLAGIIAATHKPLLQLMQQYSLTGGVL